MKDLITPRVTITSDSLRSASPTSYPTLQQPMPQHRARPVSGVGFHPAIQSECKSSFPRTKMTRKTLQNFVVNRSQSTKHDGTIYTGYVHCLVTILLSSTRAPSRKFPTSTRLVPMPSSILNAPNPGFASAIVKAAQFSRPRLKRERMH